jgi:uncharacterized damage-inducible protein DinB
MTDIPSSMPAIYAGWHTYQGLLIDALAPLTPDQLALSAAPGLRSIGDVATHMVGARARWFHDVLGEGGDEFAALSAWDSPGQPIRTAPELVGAIESTWRGMRAAITRWTPAEWAQTDPNASPGEPALTVHWVIWHLIEHDLHHGGEISLTLGMQGLKAPDL